MDFSISKSKSSGKGCCGDQTQIKNNGWGPKVWKDLHETSLDFDPNSPDNRLFELLDGLEDLPCKLCSLWWTYYRNSHPYQNKLTTRRKTVRYVFNLHNAVNKKLGREEYSWINFLRVFNNGEVIKN